VIEGWWKHKLKNWAECIKLLINNLYSCNMKTTSKLSWQSAGQLTYSGEVPSLQLHKHCIGGMLKNTHTLPFHLVTNEKLIDKHNIHLLTKERTGNNFIFIHYLYNGTPFISNNWTSNHNNNGINYNSCYLERSGLLVNAAYASSLWPSWRWCLNILDHKLGYKKLQNRYLFSSLFYSAILVH